jgi:hypothetical protein
VRERLTSALSSTLPPPLAEALVSDFLTIRQDVASGTLGRSAPGKFVESVAQALQYLHSGTYDPKPNVDQFLRPIQSASSSLDDGLRICAARIARSMYAVRSKRNIVHKGDVDPNQYDLRYLHHAAQWILSEIVRLSAGISMEEAGSLVQQIQTPVGSIVEDFGDRKIVLADLSTPKEVLILLHADHPAPVTTEQIVRSIARKNRKTVTNALRTLWNKKLVERDSDGYRLTRVGLQEAVNLIAELIVD